MHADTACACAPSWIDINHCFIHVYVLGEMVTRFSILKVSKATWMPQLMVYWIWCRLDYGRCWGGVSLEGWWWCRCCMVYSIWTHIDTTDLFVVPRLSSLELGASTAESCHCSLSGNDLQTIFLSNLCWACPYHMHCFLCCSTSMYSYVCGLPLLINNH